LPRLVGFNLASALMITGDKVSAEDAMNYGMVYKTFEDANLLTEVMATATTVASMPTKAIGLTKRLLNQSYSNNLEQQLHAECDVQVAAAKTYDYKEGVNAFLEKRKPMFKGE
jgi:2-(1,2-epoxy-1,2-dihydrophenyl)acetyl-CoA isomerase